MSRIRTVKPSFFRSLTIAELDLRARLTFIGLWTYVDDEGRGIDDARLIKAELWPLDCDVALCDVERDICDIAKHGLICRYDVADRSYIQITAWKEHQVISHPQPSSIPVPGTVRERSRNDTGTFPERSVLKGREGKGKEAQSHRTATLAALAADFEEVWKLYSRKLDKRKALRAYTARRRSGASGADLLTATKNYMRTVAGKDKEFVKYAATFFGPDEPWRDYLDLPGTNDKPYDPGEVWDGGYASVPDEVAQ